jgi:hypothetical protein
MPLLLVAIAFLLGYGSFTRTTVTRMQAPPAPADIASAMLEYHQAAVLIVMNAPATAGAVVPTMPSWYAAGTWFASCATSSRIVTWTLPAVPATPRAVAMELQNLYSNALGTGIVSQGVLYQATGAMPVPGAPCTVPDATAAVITRRL